jgi:CLIP-associating protein 1/2
VSAQVSAITSNASPARVQELEDLITALDSGNADRAALKRLALICMENTVAELSSPPPSPGGSHPSSPTPAAPSHLTPVLHSDIWEKNKTFDRFFKSLNKYLEPSRVCYFDNHSYPPSSNHSSIDRRRTSLWIDSRLGNT